MFKKLKQAVTQVLESSRKKIDFKNINYLPRWVILCFDTLILAIALINTKLIVGLLKNIEYYYFIPSGKDFIIIGINVLFFILFRTYAGLIRHSTFIDAVKFFLASAATLITALIISYSYLLITGVKIFSVPEILVYSITSFCGLFLFRMLVKQVFEVYINYQHSENQLNVLVYGTNENAIAIASALKSEKPSRYKVLGFVDKDGKNKSKEILGLPIIYIQRKIATTLRAYGAQALIIADNNLTKEESIAIVDSCLEYNFKVFRAPLISDIEQNTSLSNQIEKIQIEDILERDPIKLDNKLVAKEIYNKCILVTGGAGSIGSEIVRQVANYNPKKLLILDNAETPLYQIQHEIKYNFPDIDFEAIIADVRNRDVIEEVFKEHKPNVVYHAAAYKHVPLMERHPQEAVMVNVMGSKNIADLANDFKAEKFVMVSTDKAVNPSNVMGASKRIAEIYVQALQRKLQKKNKSKTQYVTTRFGNVLGSNGSVVPLFKKQIEEGGPLTITHPDIIRYFMTIPEACQLVIEAGAMGNGGEIFIFDMGEAVKIIDLAKKIIRLAGFTPYKEIDIKVIGLRPGEKLYEELLNDKSETLPTYNEKIMIAKIGSHDYSAVNKMVIDLAETAKEGTKNEIVLKMKDIVPEFLSMNSSFERLDKKIV
ncbi:nucleoside-diphosphate sugar epimerase/dehydratase [Lacinutrix sp. 5H-3-7-4]|uniref:polysaccharide biosynthesis protein n=1 Tax=Lacinutrix sp. (strain 5H-3-7-4) TaxID=983544 RepID=UPI00020A38B1|nr:nucleoside-diphosphate sugar epimerase/dehydratase [Lacinutrix sp. 5H-3-7-4]AEH00894.1 polysaccharide biosynthesis protein CapD [Lacinutrix sp. 5H-3-7-4]